MVRSIVVLYLIILFSSCSKDKFQTTIRLDKAAELIEMNPDSSLTILNTLKLDNLSISAERARYALLKSMALDKNFIDVTNDSLTSIALLYYKKHGTPDEKLKAYYYNCIVYLNAEDYLKFLKDPQKYSNMEFQEIKSDFNYPVAKLGDLTIHFVHYKSYEEAVDTFKRRLRRINYDNLFVIFSERDGCTYDDLKLFDSLPYKHKVVFTHLPYNDIKSSFYIKGFEDEDCLGDIIRWDNKIGRKVYDCFDFTNWLNG